MDNPIKYRKINIQNHYCKQKFSKSVFSMHCTSQCNDYAIKILEDPLAVKELNGTVSDLYSDPYL